MFKNKLLRIAVLTLALVMLLSASAFAEETESSEDTTLTFGIFSDVHSSSASTPLANVMNNIETLAGGNENVDGILMVGDIAYLNDVQQPQASTYNFLRDNADLAYFKSAGKLVYAMGNHEFTQGTKDPVSIALAKEVFIEQVGVSPESHTVLGGYHFITAGPYDYDVGGLSAEQEQYVIDEVTKALKDGEDKPVFVLIHHPIDGVLYGSGSKRHSDELVEFLKSEPRLFIFNAHNHYPTSDPRSIRQIEGGATFLYSSCVRSGGNGVTNPYATQRHDNTKAAPQGYMMLIDTKTNVVTLKRFHVDSTPEYIDAEDWVFDVPAMVAESKKDTVDLDVYKYTYEEREANSVAPVYSEDKAIEVTELTTKKISFTFPTAEPAAEGENNMVGYYKIELKNKVTGTTETIKFISDYFMKAPTQRTSYSRTFSSLSYDTEYTLSITPLNMWYKEGEPLVLEFKSEGLPSNLGKILGYDETYYAAPVSINASGDGMEIDTSAAFKLTEDNNKRLAGLYAVSKDTGFATRTVLYVYGSKESREDLYEKPSGKYSLLSGGGSGKFSPGKFSSNVWIGSAGASTFFSDSQWSRTNMVNYVFATDDPEGTEGGKTAAEKKTEAMNKMITAVKNENAYVTYTFSGKGVTPISEADTFKFGFYLHSNLGSMKLTIRNNAYRFVAYVMDLDGKVTTHSTVKDGLTLNTGSSINVATYATVNFKTDEWDIALPKEGYLVACRIYPYHGVNDPADITLTCSQSTAGTVGSGDNVRFVAVPSTFTVDVPKAEKPRGITVEGKTFKGLDKLNTYHVAPYSINGIDNTKAIEITGVTSYTLPEGSVGLYGVYFKGNDVDLISSDAFVTYIRGPYAPRADIIEVWKAGDKKLDGSIISAGNSWIGKLKHASNKNAFYPGFVAHNTTTYTGYGDIGIIADGHFTTSYAQDLWDGRAAKNTTKIATAFKSLWDEGHKYVIKYALTDEEIIPITEVNKYTFGLMRQQGFLVFNNNTVRFDAYVMNEDGDVEIFTHYFNTAFIKDETLYEVDFTTATGWEKALPTDDDCYFVGFAVYPFWDIGKESEIGFSPETRPTCNTRAQFRHVKSGYSIDIPQGSAPKNIELDGKTIKNLDETKTYVIAPYDITGKGTGIEIKNTTTYTFPSDAVGIYGIIVKGDGEYYGDSAPYIFFVRGTCSARQDLHASTSSAYYVMSQTPVLGAFSFDTKDEWSIHNSFAGGISTLGYHILENKAKREAFIAAFNATDADATAKAAAFETYIKPLNLSEVYLQYNMEADEIIPVSEIVKYSYQVKKETGGFTYDNQISEFVAIVMDEDGNVKSYTYEHAKANLDAALVTKTVDFRNKQSSYGTWKEFPESGYVIGFQYKIYANIDNPANAKISSSDTTGTRYVLFPTTEYVLDIPKTAAPKSVYVDDRTVCGLDKDVTYLLTPYSILGKGEGSTEIKNATTYTFPADAVGIYGISVKGDGEYFGNSDPVIVFARGTYKARQDLHDRATTGEWAGYYRLSSTPKLGSFSYTGSWGHHSSFTVNGICTQSDQILSDIFKTFYNKYTAEGADDDAKKAAYADMLASSNIENVHLKYNMAADEIIPISEVVKYSYSVKKERGGLDYNNQVSEFIAIIMDENGNLKEYTYQHAKANFSPTEVTKTVDFKNNESTSGKWIDTLPAEGYLVGFRLMVYANISDISNAVITKYDYGTRALVNPATEYVIDVPKTATPEGITTEGTTFKNLDPEKTYFVAPYTVLGVTEADKKKVTGVASVDIADLYENLVGLYGICYAADDYYTDSDLGAVIYVAGSVEARKSLGNLVTRTYTWNNGADSVEYECADFLKHTESKTEWALGKLAGAEYFIYQGVDYNSYKSDWMYDVPSSKALYEAKQKNDGTYEKLQKQAEATLEGISIRYAYTPEEIIPISDVIEMKFAAGMGTTYVNVSNPKYKYVLYVMNTNGTVTQHTLITKSRDITGDVQAAVNEETIRPSDFKDLPSEGWIIGYKFYPYGAVESKNITYRDSQIAVSSTQYAVNFKVPVLYFDGYYTIVEDHADFGMSLLLDGKIGIKVTADADETVTGLTVSNVVGTDSYLDFGTNDYAVFYFAPKDVANATVSFDVTYTDSVGAKTEQYELNISDYIEALLASDDEDVVNLITAFDTYFKAAADYFDDEITEVEALAGLTDDEKADLAAKSVRDRDGEVAGLEFHSTSLILEEDTTIRHYFKITDSSITTNADLEAYTVEGGSALKLANTITDAKNRYAYTDVEGISSNELAVSKTIKITDAENAFLQVDFNALSYVDISLGETDVKTLNLIKALYRYSVASDAYIAE